ncbi:uncharacterized protein [Pituophis catenifer annectens]|uniref:uncharacterized protein n=1 Tax=Pituophis catenifer annectens TaxID=94852 RepID=UPI003993C9AF
MEEHVTLVRQVLERLLKARLYVKVSKCEFHRTELEYLGYRISKDGLEMDPKKVTTVLGWQAPGTRQQLQSFLGFANFYRQFIPTFAHIALPLTNLLRTKGPDVPRLKQRLEWTEDCQRAFETLK